MAAAWLLVWTPAYAWGYELRNFLSLCDVAVLLTCLGLWMSSPLLLSMQALSSLLIDTAWVVDVVWRVATGRHLIGGTEYMWDTQWPLWLRLMSLFHVVWPPLLVYAVRRVGYEPRALAWQSLLGAALIALSRSLSTPQENLNFAFADPFLRRSLEPAALHVLVTSLLLAAIVYLPTHAALRRLAPCPSR